MTYFIFETRLLFQNIQGEANPSFNHAQTKFIDRTS